MTLFQMFIADSSIVWTNEKLSFNGRLGHFHRFIYDGLDGLQLLPTIRPIVIFERELTMIEISNKTSANKKRLINEVLTIGWSPRLKREASANQVRPSNGPLTSGAFICCRTRDVQKRKPIIGHILTTGAAHCTRSSNTNSRIGRETLPRDEQLNIHTDDFIEKIMNLACNYRRSSDGAMVWFSLVLSGQTVEQHVDFDRISIDLSATIHTGCWRSMFHFESLILTRHTLHSIHTTINNYLLCI